MKRMILMVCFVSMMSVSAMAAFYDYRSSGPLELTDGSWTRMVTGAYFDILYESNLGSHELFFRNQYGGETYPNRGAQVWTAPAGEVITGVGFYWNRQSNWESAHLAVFDLSGGNLEAAPVLWSINQPRPSADGVYSLALSESAGITAVGLGFYDTTSENGNEVRFNMISLTTSVVPEPLTMAILGLGGLFGWLRKRS